MGDPVSWFVVEPGWEVVGADGKHIGQVKEVLGDEDKDIFNGLAVSPGLLKPARYVPAESIERIEEGMIRLAIPHDRFEHLDQHDEAATT
jgi:hypothetical protein